MYGRAVLISRPHIDTDLFFKGAYEALQTKLVQDRPNMTEYGRLLESLRSLANNIEGHIPITFMVVIDPTDEQHFRNSVCDMAVTLIHTPCGMVFGIVSGVLYLWQRLLLLNKQGIWEDIRTAIRQIEPK